MPCMYKLSCYAMKPSGPCFSAHMLGNVFRGRVLPRASSRLKELIGRLTCLLALLSSCHACHLISINPCSREMKI
jgi:hypothetical protein